MYYVLDLKPRTLFAKIEGSSLRVARKKKTWFSFKGAGEDVGKSGSCKIFLIPLISLGVIREFSPGGLG